ncbi:hypothetical protein FPHYL_1229 [Fusarium phyllophilum]|uniref:Uncharacterized protein n=1 Tax=Fusarium phyllophilum TaxID=47803 RepID=A0A8H5NMT9_9HYPO|nr:hypothetical protein FPHYL_1229 [Fusarium phyllophilum]
MPFPKTEKEIMAGWSPREWEFHDWEEKNRENISDTSRPGAELKDLGKLLKEAWPNPDDRQKYLAWSFKWSGRFHDRMTYFISTEDFIEIVSQANLLDIDKVEELSRNIQVYPKPFVAIGEAKSGGVFAGYAFTPMVDFLEPKCTDSGPDVVSNMILAMNIHIPHSSPSSRVSSSSTKSLDAGSGPSLSVSTTTLSYSFSTSASSQPDSPLLIDSSDITRASTPDPAMSNENLQALRDVGLGVNNGLSSVSNTLRRKKSYLRTTIPLAMKPVDTSVSATGEHDPHMFVFAQLGLLWSYTGDWEKVRDGNPNDDKERKWKPSGFAVVVRLSPKGKPGEVYIIHHPDPIPKLKKFEDDLAGKRKSHKKKKKTSKRGLFLKHYVPRHPHPMSNSSFWIAKIADSIQDMGSYQREFEFDVVSSEESQIVNAKTWNYGLDGPTLIPACEPEEIDN